MIPNFRMGYYQNEKMGKKPVEGFEYSSLFTSKTYSILSYIVGGFVGSKSQMNNNKHNLSYDLSAVVFKLLNPCKYEREKTFPKYGENFCPPKINPYEKYIVKSSQKEKVIDLDLEVLESYMFGFEDLPSPSVERKAEGMDTMDRVGVSTPETCQRLRQQSECSIESNESESFIVFDHPEEEKEEDEEDMCLQLEDFDFESDEEEEEEGEDEEDCYCDDFDICSIDKELADANAKWKKNYESVNAQFLEIKTKKVRFNENVKINKIIAWDFAYRAARPGPWEQMARDRVRFRERILRLSPTLSPILRKEHRDKIYKKLYS